MQSGNTFNCPCYGCVAPTRHPYCKQDGTCPHQEEYKAYEERREEYRQTVRKLRQEQDGLLFRNIKHVKAPIKAITTHKYRNS